MCVAVHRMIPTEHTSHVHHALLTRIDEPQTHNGVIVRIWPEEPGEGVEHVT